MANTEATWHLDTSAPMNTCIRALHAHSDNQRHGLCVVTTVSSPNSHSARPHPTRSARTHECTSKWGETSCIQTQEMRGAITALAQDETGPTTRRGDDSRRRARRRRRATPGRGWAWRGAVRPRRRGTWRWPSPRGRRSRRPALAGWLAAGWRPVQLTTLRCDRGERRPRYRRHRRLLLASPSRFALAFSDHLLAFFRRLAFDLSSQCVCSPPRSVCSGRIEVTPRVISRFGGLSEVHLSHHT